MSAKPTTITDLAFVFSVSFPFHNHNLFSLESTWNTFSVLSLSPLV